MSPVATDLRRAPLAVRLSGRVGGDFHHQPDLNRLVAAIDHPTVEGRARVGGVGSPALVMRLFALEVMRWLPVATGRRGFGRKFWSGWWRFAPRTHSKRSYGRQTTTRRFRADSGWKSPRSRPEKSRRRARLRTDPSRRTTRSPFQSKTDALSPSVDPSPPPTSASPQGGSVARIPPSSPVTDARAMPHAALTGSFPGVAPIASERSPETRSVGPWTL